MERIAKSNKDRAMSEVGSVSIAQYASDEFIEKKSRFIGHIAPVANEEEAFSFV